MIYCTFIVYPVITWKISDFRKKIPFENAKKGVSNITIVPINNINGICML